MPDRVVDVVIVGAGAAGAATAEELRARGFEGSVLLVGRDVDPPYERPLASKGYLQGTTPRDEALLHPPSFWDEQGVEVATRVSAMKLDTDARAVKLSSGEEVGYAQGLVLATGANVNRLRVDGAGLRGIHYLRVLGNADGIRTDALADGARVVLIGGSYIACEVAASLTALGVACTMVMLEDTPLSNGFGQRVGVWAAELLRGRGIDLISSDGLERFEGDGSGGDDERVVRVVTKSGMSIDADVVVMGTGATPDVMLARAAGIDLGESGGVLCSRTLATSANGVWAAGDICEYDSVVHRRRLRIEHWEVALAQGRTVARNLLGAGEEFAEVPYFWSDLSDWATLEYVGPAASWDEEVVRGSIDDGVFSVFYGDGGRTVAALTVGRSDDLDEARELIVAGGPLPAADVVDP